MAKKATKKRSTRTPHHHSHHHHHTSNNFLLVIAGGFIVLVVLMYLVASTNSMNGNDTIPTSEANEDVVETTTVNIDSGIFSPATVTIKKGESVRFVNNDTETHTATALDGSFTTQNLAMDTSETITFRTAGVFEYRCNFHPEMRGTVIVEE